MNASTVSVYRITLAFIFDEAPRGALHAWIDVWNLAQLLEDMRRAAEALGRSDIECVFDANDVPSHEGSCATFSWNRCGRTPGTDMRHWHSPPATLKTASELLGHSGINVTANVYTHSMDEQRRAAAKLLDHHLNKALRSSSPRRFCGVSGVVKTPLHRKPA